ncbi:MAG: hypothetical protein AB7K09_05650, partial [Planctomycetota bacterium]
MPLSKTWKRFTTESTENTERKWRGETRLSLFSLFSVFSVVTLYRLRPNKSAGVSKRAKWALRSRIRRSAIDIDRTPSERR